MIRSGKIRLLLFLCLSCLFIFSADAERQSNGKNLLCIASYSADYQWTNDVLGGLRGFLQLSDLSAAIELFELNISVQEHSTPRPEDVRRIQERLNTGLYDAVVVLNNPAGELFLSGELKVRPGTPIVFSGFHDPSRTLAKRLPVNTSAIITSRTNVENIRLGLELFPHTREIVVLTGAADDGKAIHGELLRNPPALAAGQKLTLINGAEHSTEYLLTYLKALPPDSIVIYNDWFTSGDGPTLSRISLQEKLKDATSHIPVMINTDNLPFSLGLAVGGALTPGNRVGRSTGAILYRILRGAAPGQIPISEVKSELVFDDNVLRKFDIAASALPAGAEVLNIPPSFAGRYAHILLPLSIILALLLFGILCWLPIWRRMNRRLRAVFDAFPARIMVMDHSGKLLFNRVGGQDLYREELLALKTIKPEEYPELRETALEVLRTGIPTSIDYPGIYGRHRQANFQKLPAEVFGVESVIWTSVDTEELHQLRLKLQQIAGQLQLTLESIGDGVIVTDADEKVTLINKVAEELTGFSAAESAGRNLDDIFHIISYIEQTPVPSPLRKALKSREIVTLANHTDLVAKDGSRRHIADSAAPIIDAGGKLTGAVLVFRDVTEEYLRRDRLHVQNAVLEKALAAGEMTFFRCNGEGVFLQEAGEKFWPRRNGRPQPLEEWVCPEDIAPLQENRRKLFAGTIREFQYLYRVHLQQHFRYFRLQMFEDVSPISDQKEFFGIIQDVTDFRERELSSQNATALLRDVIDNMPGYIWVKDVEHGLRNLIVSRNIGDILGVPEEKIIGAVDSDFLQMKDAKPFEDADNCALRHKHSESTIPLFDPTGERHDLKVIQTLLERPDGTRLLLGIGMDITRELKMENQLHEKNRLLEEIFDNLPVPLFIKDFHNEDRYLFASRKFGAMVGIEKAALIGHTDYELFPQEFARGFIDDDARAMASDIPHLIFEDVKLVDGTVAKYQTQKVKLKRDSGNDLLLGVGIDITELNEHRNELKKANELLYAIMDKLPCALFVKDADHEFRYLMHNRVFAEAFGLTGKEVIGRNDFELLLPENSKCCFASDQAVLASGGTCDANEEVLLDDGERHTLRCIKSIVTGENGRRMLLGISLDVTQEKLLNQERQKLVEELQVYGSQQRALNAALECILLSGDFAEAIKRVLQLIGERAQADRCYIFSRDYKTGRSNNDFEWTAPGINPEIDHLQDLPLVLSPSWEKALNEHEVIFSPRLDADGQSPAIMESQQELMRQNIKSILVTGIWVDGKLWGFIGFDYVREYISYPEIAEKMLTATARIIEIALVRQLRQLEFERSEYEKQLIMDTINTPIMLYDANMKLLRINNAARKIAITPVETAPPDTPCYRFFCGEDVCPDNCPVRQSLDDHLEHTHTMHIRGRDYMISANPIVFGGKLEYVLKTMLDITDFNTIQQKLTLAMLDAQNASKAKSYFLATMSHELRTPLNAVIGFSELLRNNTLPRDEQNEYLQSINFAGNALLKLINDILDLSKIESGQTEIVPEKSDFVSLCREIHSIFKLQAAEKHLEFTVECPESLPSLYLDTLRLRQILLNLTGNALKFTPKGSIRITVEFKPESPESGMLVIQVTDTGIGISEKGRRTIFEPFVQEREIRGSHAYQGTGLGLAISSRLIRQMGGELTLESELGRGSCFTVTLHDIRYEKALPLSEAPAEEVVAVPPDASDRPLSMLLVDDVPMNLKVLSAMLRKLHVDVCCAPSGEEALRILKTFKPELILTDMWMPGMNGTELAEAVRALPGGDEIKIIAVTADTEARSNFGVSHLDGIMLKPLTLEKLRKLIDAYQQGKPLESSIQ